MKKIVLVVAVVSALIISQAASADNRHSRRGYNSYGYGSYSSRNYSRNYNRYNPYHYGYRGRRGGSYLNFSYGNHLNNRYYYRGYGHYGHHDSSSFIGGLVLGSLLSYPSYSSRSHNTVTYSSRPVSSTRETVYVNQSTPAGTSGAASGRRLLRDLEGNCFEREVDEQGNEIRVQLEAEACNF